MFHDRVMCRPGMARRRPCRRRCGAGLPPRPTQARRRAIAQGVCPGLPRPARPRPACRPRAPIAAGTDSRRAASAAL